MFTHLHTHTEYSLLDGSNKIHDYVQRVKSLGQNSAAITDHGVMYGVIDFYKECKKENIKPIIGCEVYVAVGSRHEKNVSEDGEKYYHLVLLAENNKGYENLSKIVSRSFTEGFYYKPRVDMELLEEFHEGLIALSACLAGEVARAISHDDLAKAKDIARRYEAVFGKGNFFLELQDHGYPEQRKVNTALLRISQELQIPLVTTNDCHYTNEKDADAHDVLLCIQTNKKLADENRMRYPGGQFYVKSEEEMRKLFPYALQAVENTQRIADRCHVEIEFGNTKLPRFDVPKGYDSWTYLQKLCNDGMKERYPNDDGSIRKRLEYELSTIHQMGYVDYFLIVWDYINYAREHRIPVGPGRGSAAGSVASYCLHITNIDPIRYGLIFERFLNPERVSMPDIDVDFCYERRGEVIDYVTEKYGRDCVTQIVTFNTMAARAVIKDVGRAMDLPYSFVGNIAKMIPNELKITIKKALGMNPELKNLYDSNSDVHSLIDTAMKLEGLPRNTSVHAAGVVICAEPAENLIPLAKAQNGGTTTQFTMTTVEELGLLKMDFLGLKTLTVIQDAFSMINEDKNRKSVSLDDIRYDDENVYRFISSGQTDGVFQLESKGMQEFMKKLRPQNFEDIIAGISLYRPGPMEFIPEYLKGKQNPKEVTYMTEALRPILENTYGAIIYQEQVMQIVRDLGGYTIGRSDLVRRAMSKKKQHVMEQERKNFVYGNREENVPGCISRGISPEIANAIYDTMMDFAKYAFNKSHAACYAIVAYQTAWLKCYYPAQYMAALMTSVTDKPDKLSGYIAACKSLRIDVLGPDVNLSHVGFHVENSKIRFALSAIKGAGMQVVKGIVKERTENGLYKDISDFMIRTNNAEIGAGKDVLEGLIYTGSFDRTGATRKQLIAAYPMLTKDLQKQKKHLIPGQMSLFDVVDDDVKTDFNFQLPNVGEFDLRTRLAREKEAIGVYVSGHPMESIAGMWRKKVTRTGYDFAIDEETELPHTNFAPEEEVIVGGIITAIKVIYTKKDNLPMAFVTLEDIEGSIEVVVFAKQYEKYKELLVEDEVIFVRGKVGTDRDGKPNVRPFVISSLEEAQRTVWILTEDYQKVQRLLVNKCRMVHGNSSVVIQQKSTRRFSVMSPLFSLELTEDTVRLLTEVFGKDKIFIDDHFKNMLVY